MMDHVLVLDMALRQQADKPTFVHSEKLVLSN
jgi:hypothetical protein